MIEKTDNLCKFCKKTRVIGYFRKDITRVYCKECLTNKTFFGLQYLTYRRMSRKNSTYGGAKELPFSFEEFCAFLENTRFKSMFTIYKKSGFNRHNCPSVDRINSWMPYTLENLQVISCIENASKGNQPALGALHKTMKFFKRLREDRKLSKYEMANFLGMLPQTYYYYEDKARGCSFEILCLIRSKLKLSWEELGKYIDDEFDSFSHIEQTTVHKRTKKDSTKN